MLARAAIGEHEVGPDAFVFSERLDCSQPYRPDRVTGFFTRLRTDLGLPHVHLHSCRHFMATQLASRGDVSARTLAGRLGHADASVSPKVYSHFFPPTDIEADRFDVRPREYGGQHGRVTLAGLGGFRHRTTTIHRLTLRAVGRVRG